MSQKHFLLAFQECSLLCRWHSLRTPGGWPLVLPSPEAWAALCTCYSSESTHHTPSDLSTRRSLKKTQGLLATLAIVCTALHFACVHTELTQTGFKRKNPNEHVSFLVYTVGCFAGCFMKP